jgi:hypothetical protein
MHQRGARVGALGLLAVAGVAGALAARPARADGFGQLPVVGGTSTIELTSQEELEMLLGAMIAAPSMDEADGVLEYAITGGSFDPSNESGTLEHEGSLLSFLPTFLVAQALATEPDGSPQVTLSNLVADATNLEVLADLEVEEELTEPELFPDVAVLEARICALNADFDPCLDSEGMPVMEGFGLRPTDTLAYVLANVFGMPEVETELRALDLGIADFDVELPEPGAAPSALAAFAALALLARRRAARRG